MEKDGEHDPRGQRRPSDPKADPEDEAPAAGRGGPPGLGLGGPGLGLVQGRLEAFVESRLGSVFVVGVEPVRGGRSLLTPDERPLVVA